MRSSAICRPAALAVVMLGVGVIAAPAAAGGGSSGAGDDQGGAKVTICHATNSDKRPYKEKSISARGALNGHGRHHAAKAVWSPGMKAKHQKWGDIVPAFGAGGQDFDGLNLDTEGGADDDTSGQEILDAACTVGVEGG